ncbi:MAG: PHP domain-containing protein, partial [Pseudomonadota bacterium]
MTDSPFIHLAVRSSYSLLESMITTKALAAWAAEQEMPAVAVTDRNNMFGALERSEALASAGVQPIMACLFDIVEDSYRGETSEVRVFAQDDQGYRTLRGRPPRTAPSAAD